MPSYSKRQTFTAMPMSAVKRTSVIPGVYSQPRNAIKEVGISDLKANLTSMEKRLSKLNKRIKVFKSRDKCTADDAKKVPFSTTYSIFRNCIKKHMN